MTTRPASPTKLAHLREAETPDCSATAGQRKEGRSETTGIVSLARVRSMVDQVMDNELHAKLAGSAQSGGLGGLLPRGSHRSGRAEFPHPAPRFQGFAFTVEFAGHRVGELHRETHLPTIARSSPPAATPRQ